MGPAQAVFLLLLVSQAHAVQLQGSAQEVASHNLGRLPRKLADWEIVRSEEKESWTLGLNNGLGRTPPMGWNSWNYFNCNISEALIRETAKALVDSGLAELGYTYLNIDDCWAAEARDTEGNLIPDPVTFPSGIKALADEVHALGLKFGIYSDAGFKTCAGRPGSLGYEERDAAAFASWGVDYLKYDNCFTDGTLPFKRYVKMRDALLKTKRPIFYSLCEKGEELVALWGPSVANSWRVYSDIDPNWNSMTRRADLNNIWWRFAGPGGWNDPDMLEVGNEGMSEAEQRSHFSIWSLAKAPLLLGCDIRNMSAVTSKLIMNKEVIAVNQDPLGVQGHLRKLNLKGHQVWAGPLTNHRVVALLWNRSEKEATITAHFNDIGFPEHRPAKIRDLWPGEWLTGPFDNEVSLVVGSHDVRMLVLEGAEGSAAQADSVILAE